VDLVSNPRRCPFGTFRVRVAGEIVEDPNMPPDWIVNQFALKGLFLEVMPAIEIERHCPVVKTLPYGDETRGYLYMRAVRRASAPYFGDALSRVVAQPMLYPRAEVHAHSSSLFVPRDVGKSITLEDCWFLQNALFYVAEKTDGIGAIVTIAPGGEGTQALMTVRLGAPSSKAIHTFLISGYTGPFIALDGEYQDHGHMGWTFDAYGLIRYDDTDHFVWYSGMSLLLHWLRGQHQHGCLLNIGIKRWQKCTPFVLSQVWEQAREGVVLKFGSSPTPRMRGQVEYGNAKYLKKIVTFDLSPRPVPGGYDPPVRGLPATYTVGQVIECKIDGKEYVYVRTRHDKSLPNPPDVLSEKLQSATFDDVQRWIARQVDLFPMEVDEGDEQWEKFLDLGDAVVDDHFKLALAATGYRMIIFNRGGRRYESPFVYEMRSKYFIGALTGSYDAIMPKP